MIKDLAEFEHVKSHYPITFSPIRIRHVEIPNRVVYPPWVINYGSFGKVTAELSNFYRKMAEGGTGLVTVGAAGIGGEAPPGYEGALRIDKDEYIPGLRNLFDMLKGYG